MLHGGDGVLPDPGNKLCTVDFEGPSPHNSNLAAKGIIGLGAYQDILKRLGTKTPSGVDVAQKVKEFADFWAKNAAAKSGDKHYKLQYDTDDHTWSLKYNLLWDKVLKLNAGFHSTGIDGTETAFYLKKFSEVNSTYPYGVPLDSRGYLTKNDWQMWVGALDDALFAVVTDRVWKFANETQDRVPSDMSSTLCGVGVGRW